MIPVISIVGNSKVGKTNLLKYLIREIQSRGYRVAAVKHSATTLTIDEEAKDTGHFWEAGADVVLFSGPREFMMLERVEEEYPLERILEMVSGKVDIVLTEGYKKASFPKIVVYRRGAQECVPDDKERIAAVPGDSHQLAKELADIIIEKYLK